MTSRQRQATGSASATMTVSNGVGTSPERSLPFSWDEWFRHASPQQRAAALGLARQQGLLYPHQLPAVTNGVKSPAAPLRETAASALLSRIFTGVTEPLAAPIFSQVAFYDQDLDALQQQTVARALGAPDIFLLQGLPGSGKSRVLAEVIHQAAARGQRVLFLGAHAASVDGILHRLVGRTEIFALRFLEGHERPETLPPWLRGFTLEEQKQAFVERILTGARGNREEAESACRAHRAEEPLWTELPTCLQRCQDASNRLQHFDAQIAQVVEAVERAAATAMGDDPFHTRLIEMRQGCDAALDALDVEMRANREALTRCDSEGIDLAARITALEPAYLAKKQTRFWTQAFWLNLFNGQVIATTEALLAQQTEIQARRQALAAELNQLEAQRQQRLGRFHTDRLALIAAEIDARKQALQRDRQAFVDAAHPLNNEWDERCRQLKIGGIEKTLAGIVAAHETRLARKRHDEEHCQFAQQWSKFLEQTGPQLAARLPSFANLIAGTVERWQSDAKFQAAVGGPLDLVVLEDADALTDADLLKLSRHGQRCILSAQAMHEATPAPTPSDKLARAPLTPAACWQKLWQALGGDAGAWPCTWRREQGRLVCQLLSLASEDRQHLECERLADAPDIELNILHRPRTKPSLAQVTFAPSCSFADAFRFLVREVQEFPLEPVGRTGWWDEDDRHVRRHLAPITAPIADWLEIEPGVRLGTVDTTRIACIEFDKSAGWDRARADAWLRRHRPAHDGERTAFLQNPYRFQRSLGPLVQAVIRADDWLPQVAAEPAGESRAFEFVAVPAPQKHAWPRDGAGLELDLSASRFTDSLPAGLRQGLPTRGFVNYLEAQTLIRRLETFAQKDVNGHPCRVAVLALFEGQVELLRRLIAQSEVLRNSRVPIEVALPSRLTQRECDVAFLSMTRSHGHRAVAFGEDVRELPLALTRARGRLFLFADPGSLSKRVTWHGPVDQLDAAAAHQELVRLTRLVAFLQSHEPSPAPTNGKVHA